MPGSADKYLAVFNTRSQPKDGVPATDANNGAAAVPVKLSDLGFPGAVVVENLWTHQQLGPVTNEFAPVINCHGAGLYRILPAN